MKNTIWFAAALVLPLVLTACGDDESAFPTTTLNPTGYPTPSTSSNPPAQVGVVNNNGFYVQLDMAQNISTFTHVQGQGPNVFQTPCFIKASQVTTAVGASSSVDDLYCIADIEEGDLYMNDFKMNVNAPAGMCPYIEFHPYAYYSWPSGQGPTTATVNINSINSPPTVTGTAMCNGVPCCDGTNPAYNFDHTAAAGPNCCYGNYTIVTNTTTLDTTASPTPIPVTATTVTQGAYPGQDANCMSGPGTLSPVMTSLSTPQASLNTAGYPIPIAYVVPTTGLNFEYTIPSPISRRAASNVSVANYWMPTDVTANASDVSELFSSGTVSPSTLETVAPNAMNRYASGVFTSNGKPVPKGQGFTFPYYEVSCLDNAFDLTARIRVLVRSWDTVQGFTAESNPYNGTNDPAFNIPWHNFGVWKDVINSTDGYPEGGE